MSEADDDRTRGALGASRTAAYVVTWLVSVALILLDVALVRSAYLAMAAWWANTRITRTAERINFNFMISFVDRVLLVVMVIAGLVGVIVLERRFRALAEERELLRKGWKPLAILAAIGAVAFFVRFLL